MSSLKVLYFILKTILTTNTVFNNDKLQFIYTWVIKNTEVVHELKLVYKNYSFNNIYYINTYDKKKELLYIDRNTKIFILLKNYDTIITYLKEYPDIYSYKNTFIKRFFSPITTSSLNSLLYSIIIEINYKNRFKIKLNIPKNILIKQDYLTAHFSSLFSTGHNTTTTNINTLTTTLLSSPIRSDSLLHFKECVICYNTVYKRSMCCMNCFQMICNTCYLKLKYTLSSIPEQCVYCKYSKENSVSFFKDFHIDYNVICYTLLDIHVIELQNNIDNVLYTQNICSTTQQQNDCTPPSNIYSFADLIQLSNHVEYCYHVELE
jgi:hypothetical protein